MKVLNNNNNLTEIYSYPDECPICKKKITPIPLYCKINGDVYDIFFLCPDHQCQCTFIAKYYNFGHFDYISKGFSFQKTNFSDTINTLSPNFVKIYNEAYEAEQMNLYEICGIGYRKALEFLLKDFAIGNNQDEEENIKKNYLSDCIKKYITNDHIKQLATRATWLGNDETHYTRKWEDKTVHDLKELIKITVNYLEMEIRSKELIASMN